MRKKEAELSLSYSNFRPHIDQKSLSENDIREILKKKKSHKSEKKAWEASKEIGGVLAPQILQLVGLRNQAAKHLGYDNFFEMQLDLQEVDGTWLFNTLENLADHSDAAYSTMLNWIEQQQIANFQSVSMS